MKLTFEQINELLIDDDLQLPSEIVAFQIAMKWLEFDQKRVKYAADLLSNIRFGTISAQDLVNYVQSVPRMMQEVLVIFIMIHPFLKSISQYLYV